MLAAATDTELRISRIFKATPERVFQAWTTAEEMKQWASPPAMTIPFVAVDLRVGGRYEIHMRAANGTERRVAGVYREITPPRRLVYTWLWEEPSGSPETLVTVDFLKHAAGTEVVLVHDQLPTRDARDQHAKGWAGCLSRLQEMFG